MEISEDQPSVEAVPPTRTPHKPDPVETIEDEEAEADEDDADGIGARPNTP
jgi:hypothetical protein